MKNPESPPDTKPDGLPPQVWHIHGLLAMQGIRSDPAEAARALKTLQRLAPPDAPFSFGCADGP